MRGENVAKRRRVFRADRLQDIRTMRGLTQEELAAIMSVQQSQLARYESGDSEPTPDMIARFAVKLDVTTDFLLGLVDLPNANVLPSDLSAAEHQLLAALRRKDFRELFRIISQETPEAGG